MPTLTHSDLVAVPLRILAFLSLIVADSEASPIPQTIGSRGTGITSSDENLMSIKNILEWLFAAAAVIVVCSVFVWRVRFLRARGRPLQDFFSFIEAPQTGGWSPSTQHWRQARSGIPLSQQRMGTTRATDIDPEGRRVGGPDSDDINGDVTEKDVLPAYEVKGGPPNYNHFSDVDLGTGTNPTLQITEAVPVGAVPQPQTVETGSRSTNSSTDPVSGIQPPRPPPPSYIPVTAATHHATPSANP